MFHLNKKNIFFITDLTWPKRHPPTKILWVQPVTLHLNKKFFFITDLTWPKRLPPGQNFMGANCNVTPDAHSRHNNNHVLPKRSTMLKSFTTTCSEVDLAPEVILESFCEDRKYLSNCDKISTVA